MGLPGGDPQMLRDVNWQRLGQESEQELTFGSRATSSCSLRLLDDFEFICQMPPFSCDSRHRGLGLIGDGQDACHGGGVYAILKELVLSSPVSDGRCLLGVSIARGSWVGIVKVMATTAGRLRLLDPDGLSQRSDKSKQQYLGKT